MSNIDLKFSPEMAKAAIEGRKCCTSRRSQKGDPGDEFEYEGVRFRLIDILLLSVLDIAFNYYRCEGFDTRDECAAELHRIYPDKGYNDRLYVHFLARCP